MSESKGKSRFWTFVFLCMINLLSYMDRSIISGAPSHFEIFIQLTLNIPFKAEGFYLGIVTSSFIGTYAFCSIFFGYLVTIDYFQKPFHLLGGTLLMFCLAMVCCGFSYQFSFFLLLTGRILSGIGQSSFMCVVMPFLLDHSPADKKTIFIGFFLSTIPIGTALGFEYGSRFANSLYTWKWAYFIEGIVMFPFAVYCFFIDDKIAEEIEYPVSGMWKSFKSGSYDGNSIKNMEIVDEVDQHKHSFCNQLFSILQSATFSLVVLGTAAQMFFLAALNSFGPNFLLGFQLFDKDYCCLAYGVIIILSGTIGTPLGGIMLDKVLHLENISSFKEEQNYRKHMAVRQMLVSSVIAVAFIISAWFMLSVKFIFLLLLFLSLLTLYSILSCATVAILSSVPVCSRPLAVAINSFIIHTFGDVPSPILLGKIKGLLAPYCDAVTINRKLMLNPKCKEDYDGLRYTLLAVFLWLGWIVFFYGGAYISVKRKSR